MTLPITLPVLRAARGLSQRQLGTAIGVSGATVARWEAGAVVPSIDRLRDLGRYLDLTDAELGELARRLGEVHAPALP